MQPLTFSSLAEQNAEFCGKVPLHQTNLLQPHACLFLVRQSDLVIIQVGENCASLLQTTADQIIGQSLSQFLQPQHLAQIRDQQVSESLPYPFAVGEAIHHAAIKKSGDLLFVEVENSPYDRGINSFKDIYRDLKHIAAEMERAECTDQLCETAARELKRISGFDKVMIYQFDQDWNGDVVAEALEEGMDSYMGLKFPASDIPRQARELYKTTPYRVIPAVDYEPVKLYPLLNPETQTFTDLSACNLRSVAQVHLEYLRNMGVQASMSTRIMLNGELWGLIACHHRQPHDPGYEICSQLELLSMLISSKLSAMQLKDVFTYKNGRQQLLTDFLEDLFGSQDLFQAAEKNQEELLRLLAADGVAVCANHKVRTFGEAPPPHVVEELLFWLRAKQVTGIYTQNALPQHMDEMQPYAGVATGVIALPIQPSRYIFILGFRPEAVKEVQWAGNPYESIQMEPGEKRYHPRASFRSWQEQVHHTATDWNREQLDVAESLRQAVVEYYLNFIQSSN